MDYTVLGISSGVGVSLFPFREHIIGNIESRAIFHTPHEEQWKANFGERPFTRALGINQYKPDIIISSPDCGNSSILRMSRAKVFGDHKDNHSLLLFLVGVQKYKPKFFLLENLPGLFKSFPKEMFEDQLSGYRFIYHVAPVSMWGNSQVNRQRLVIVGIRQDIPETVDKEFVLPDLRCNNQTCEQLYGDLDKVIWDPSIGHVRENLDSPLTIYARKKITIMEAKDYWDSNPGTKRWQVIGERFDTAPGVYRNRLKDYPATARKANRQFDHRGYMLTPRQLARIQGVPDRFIIYIEVSKLNYWINKARAAVTKTPPYEISLWFKRKLKKTYHIWQRK